MRRLETEAIEQGVLPGGVIGHADVEVLEPVLDVPVGLC
jgi:hypothetical protein